MNDRRRLSTAPEWRRHSISPEGSRNRIRLTDPLQNHRIYIRLSNLRTTAKLIAVRQPSGHSNRRRIVDKNKYLIGLIGLAVGFIISFFLTQNYNRSNAAPAASVAPSGMPGGGAAGAGGQQAMMGQIQQVIDKAKNGPNDFQAQVEAAKVFNQIGRVAETADY